LRTQQPPIWSPWLGRRGLRTDGKDRKLAWRTSQHRLAADALLTDRASPTLHVRAGSLGAVDDAVVNPSYAVIRDENGRADFDLYTGWSPAIRRAFFSSRADGLVANYARGFVGSDVEFVRDLPLRRLNILDRGITDLTPVHDLASTLEELSVEVAPGAHLDLTLLPRLRVLACAWDQVKDTIASTDRLEDLYFSPYRAPDLTPLAHLTSLRSLRMKPPLRVRSLDGVQTMPWLARLSINAAPLEDTRALARLSSPVLTRLDVPSCRRLATLDDFSGLIGLRELDVSESGPLAGLAPITGLAQLERLYLYGSTNITDGDLTPLLPMSHLRDFRMQNRRHYSPTVAQVQKHFGIQP
jgi:hypothetical protein